MFEQALLTIFNPMSLLTIFGAMVLSMVLGILPGIGPSISIALTMPFTFFMEPAVGLGTLVAIYNGAIYGGSISAILINVPGTPGSAATCADGFAMSQRGDAGRALGISLSASVFGGIASAFALLLIAPVIAKFALLFGPAEYFWLATWGLTVIAAVTGGKHFITGIIASLIGFLFALVGVDSITGGSRYTFHNLNLFDGIEMLALVIGTFAAAQVLIMANEGGSISKAGKITGKIRDGIFVPFKWGSNLVTCLKSTGIGILFGAIPAVGMSAASFFSYAEAMRSSKTPEKFGSGMDEGIIAPEASNNATVGGGLIPALTLGIPGTESTAILLGAIFAYGLRPGTNIFVEHADVFYAIVVSLILSSAIMLFLGYLGAPFWAKITIVPGTMLVPIITVICFIGAYATGSSKFNILVVVVTGILAFVMKRYGYSLISFLLGFVLAPLVEDNFVRAMMISGGSYTGAFFSSWLSNILALLVFFSLFWAIKREFFKKKKPAKPSIPV